MRHLEYHTQGTCSRLISLSLRDDDTIDSVAFVGGCHGNLQGIGRLVAGMKATDVIARLKGVRCGVKPTSCPDQLACALEEILRRKA